MSITTYSLTPTTAPTSVNLTTAGDQFSTDAVTLLNGNAVSVYGDANNVYLRLISPSGAPTGTQVQVNLTAGVDTSVDGHFAQAARLANGNIVVSWTSAAGNRIFSRVFSPALTPVTGEIVLGPFGAPLHPPAVAALTGGGYVIAFQYDSSGTQHYISASRFSDTGGALGGIINVNSTAGTLNDSPSVAGLNDGGFAIIHHRAGFLGSTVMWRSVFNPDGSTRAADAAFDATGFTNSLGDVVALSGGGFTAVYNDTDWAPPQQDLTGVAFNAAGGFAAAGSLGRDASIAGTNMYTQAALSPDGFVFVASTNFNGNNHNYGAVLAPDGFTVLARDLVVDTGAGNQIYGQPTWLDRTHVLVTETVSGANAVGGDGNGGGVAARVLNITRNVVGTNVGETLNYSNDAFDSVISEGTGNNMIFAGAGVYNVVFNGGNNTYVGGANSSTVFALGGSNYLQGGAGSPSDVLVASGAGINTFYGGSGNNYIVGGTGKNTIVGGAGPLQSLYGNGSGTGANGDYIVAGAGASNVLAENGTGSAQLWGSLTGNNYIVGGAQDDLLVGGAGTNYFFGAGGNDTIYGGSGTNYIYGGAGNDFIYTNPVGTQSTGYVYEGLGGGVDTVADFTPGDGANRDVIVISAGSGFANFNDIIAKTTQIGVYTVISLSLTDQVYLYNVQPFQLTANDFIFS